VHVVTDSTYTRDGFAAGLRPGTKHPGLWAAFAAFRRYGFVITCHWLPRETSALNVFADSLARAARLQAAHAATLAPPAGEGP
jgi:hypothetical protein